MKEIVVISGKGGTGKTSLTASFAYLGGKDVIVADCDVDAADMHLLLKPDFAEAEDFYSGELAYIEQDRCIRCGKCADVCRFDAIENVFNTYKVDRLACEGCGYCSRICPTHAIINKKRLAGEWYISQIKTGSLMVHAKLGIGADNSGKLVAKVKNEAKKIAEDEFKDFILVDGSPGIGCPVVSSLSGAHFVVMVTEPSVPGFHDLKRLFTLIKKFSLKAGCIINKFDINKQITKEIENYLKEENILHIANLPYNEDFIRAMTKGQTVVEYTDGGVRNLIEQSWNKIKDEIK
ncbi:MAG: ATP-binding protein [Bacteroidales bacterium]|nr:ATP-binding protein [Bacteroidales bacterium]